MKHFRFTFMKSGILMDLNTYKQHTKNVEIFLEKEVKAFEKQAEETTATWDEYERAEYYENASDQHWELSKVYPNIQRKSELISIYTILENTINKICKVYESSIDNPVKIKDLEAYGIIDQGKRYLEKVVRIEFPKTHKSWVEIMKIQQVRNSFVHANGYVKYGNNDLIKYIKQSNFLELNEHNEIKIKNGFSTHCLDVFSDFFIELFSKMSEKK